MRKEVSIRQVGKEEAENILDQPSPYQRAVSRHHVSDLAMALKRGEFTENTLHLATDKHGKKHLVNGQHTLHAIVKCGIPATMTVRVDHDCTDEEIRQMYINYDIQRRRSFGATAKAFGMAENADLPPSYLNYIAGAINYGASNFGVGQNVRLSPSILHTHVPQWIDETILFKSDIAGTAYGGDCMKRSVMSVALIMYRYEAQRASDFWRAVATGEEMKSGDPRKHLHDWLPRTRRPSYGPRPYSDSKISRVVALAWEKYAMRQDVKRLDVRNDAKPIRIWGCPGFSGNQLPNSWPGIDLRIDES